VPADAPKRLKFIGCEIIHREACALAARSPHFVDLEFLRKGLHDLERKDMTGMIQERIDAVDADRYDAVILGYARCNDGLAGVRAGALPLVIAKAHDCITFFFGSREAYREYFDAHPGTYYLTTGWCERNTNDEQHAPAYGRRGVMANLGLTESYEDMVAKYGKDNADFILETMGGWKKGYNTVLYLEMGLCDEEPFLERARRHAAGNAWEFQHRRGDWSLLEKLFFGRWDEDFVIAPPGRRIVARNDDDVLGVE
jgi:hypothetical protein